MAKAQDSATRVTPDLSLGLIEQVIELGFGP